MSSQMLFLSYNTGDRLFVDAVCGELQNRGFRVWYAPDRIKAGDRFRGEIVQAIKSCDFLVLFASSNSVGNQERGTRPSLHVLSEVTEWNEEYHSEGIIPLDLDGVLANRRVISDDFRYLLSGQHHIDCCNSVQTGNPGFVCSDIASRISHGSADAPGQTLHKGSDYEEQLKTMLLKGWVKRAFEDVQSRPASRKPDNDVRVLEIVSLLSFRFIRDLKLDEADALSEELIELLEHCELARQSRAMAFYCLGALAAEFYEYNSLRSPIGSFRKIKEASCSAGTPLSKTRKLLASVSKDPEQFNRRWLS